MLGRDRDEIPREKKSLVRNGHLKRGCRGFNPQNESGLRLPPDKRRHTQEKWVTVASNGRGGNAGWIYYDGWPKGGKPHVHALTKKGGGGVKVYHETDEHEDGYTSNGAA